MYVIVVGAGAIGSQVIDLAVDSRHEVAVVESDSEVAEAASRAYDCMVINADATVKETLADAGTDRADAVISTTDDDATNVMVMLLAAELDVPSLVSVVHNPAHMGLFRRIGANVIENPQRLIAEYLFRAVQRPSIRDFMHLGGGAEVFEIAVTEEAPIAEMSLVEADEAGLIDEGMLVVAIQRGEEILTPRGETVVSAGDVVTVFSREGFSEDVTALFTGESGGR
jgi:trk system potassium uptake protein TrkA